MFAKKIGAGNRLHLAPKCCCVMRDDEIITLCWAHILQARRNLNKLIPKLLEKIR